MKLKINEKGQYDTKTGKIETFNIFITISPTNSTFSILESPQLFLLYYSTLYKTTLPFLLFIIDNYINDNIKTYKTTILLLTTYFYSTTLYFDNLKIRYLKKKIKKYKKKLKKVLTS